MSITYENSTQCLNCWTTQSYHPASHNHRPVQSVPQAPFQKLSLKKHEKQQKADAAELASTQHTPASKTVEQSYFQQHNLYLPLKPSSLLWPEKEFQIRGSGHKKSLCSKPKTKEEQRESEIIVNDDLCKQNIRASLDSSSGLKKTLKLKRAEGDTLKNSVRMIPKSSQSLFQLSKMKHSVLSILEGENNKPRLQQSVILMNFFHPDTQMLQKIVE